MEKNNSEKMSEVKVKLPFNNLFLNTGYISGDNGGVKYTFTILITIFAYFLYQIFIGLVLVYFAQQNGISIYDTETLAKGLTNPETLGISKNFMLALLLGMFVFTFLAFRSSIKKIHKKQFISLITAYPNIRWYQVFFSFAVWSIVFGLMFITDYLWISKDKYILNFNWQNFMILFIISILLLPIQTSFEELFFRGYLMQGFALVFKNGYIPLILTSLLFGMAHMNNPEAEEFGAWIMLPYYSLFGVFLGITALWNNGLELSIGIHAANNILSALLITSKNSVLQTDAAFSIKQENPLNDFMLWTCGAIITLVIFQYKYRFKNHIQLLK